jgi:hypothetical protein
MIIRPKLLLLNTQNSQSAHKIVIATSSGIGVAAMKLPVRDEAWWKKDASLWQHVLAFCNNKKVDDCSSTPYECETNFD